MDGLIVPWPPTDQRRLTRKTGNCAIILYKANGQRAVTKRITKFYAYHLRRAPPRLLSTHHTAVITVKGCAHL